MLTLLLTAPLALAAGPNDLGVLQNADIKVVQKQLYVKEGRTELGAGLGIMPFDGFTLGTQLALSATKHASEKLAYGLHVGGGYGFKTAHYDLLESPTYGVAVEAYRYLASIDATAEYSPIYAKMKVGGTILHHDVYFLGGAGLTVEQSVLPSHDMAFAPTVPLGVGARIWLKGDTALRLELRDQLMIEKRVQSGTTAFKQNVVLSAGIGRFGKAKK